MRPVDVTLPRLAPSTVLRHQSACVIRPQKARYLVYNSTTDELHLLSPAAHYVYQLCDGMRSVGEIQYLLSQAFDEESLGSFLSGLVARQLLESIS
jgi:hypothetical protein